MAVRNYIRDAKGRFSSRGGGTISGPKRQRPQPKGGSMTRALRRGQTELYKAEQTRAQGLMRLSGGGSVAGLRLIRGGIRRGANQRAASAAPATSSKPRRVSDALRDTLRELAQSDARYIREIQQITGTTRKKPAVRGSSKQKRLKG
jgi:hypothetical protein